MIAELRKFIGFLAVGGVNAAFGYTAFAILLLLGIAPTPAVIGATIAGLFFNFGSMGALFGSHARHRFPRYVATYAVTLAANIALLHVIMAMGIPALIGQAMAVLMLSPLSFLMMRRFVFARTS